ncbi:MAG TPA: hypothetical protein VM367_08015 [Pseudonocardia sp.]|nr:hypothetical protein [Pseudonocardia sp.]
MPHPSAPADALARARRARGWSQAEAAQALAELVRARGPGAASPASLKTQLSRWENGHVLPDAAHRRLLAELYGCPPAELGLGEPPGSTATARLRAALAFAAGVDAAVVGAWGAQLTSARELDRRLGAAGAAAPTRALAADLARAAAHLVDGRHRTAVLRLLSAAAALSGWQELDTGDAEAAWDRFGGALGAAREGAAPALVAEALVGRAAVLVEVGEPDAARTVLDRAPPEAVAGPVAARLAAAVGLACAAAGDGPAARAAFARAEAALQGDGPADPEPGRPVPPAQPPRADPTTGFAVPVELGELHAWHGRALLALGDPAATALERAVAAEPSAVRTRAAVHADLAVALRREGRAAEAAEHSTRARRLAERSGTVLPAPPPPRGAELAAAGEPTVAGT